MKSVFLCFYDCKKFKKKYLKNGRRKMLCRKMSTEERKSVSLFYLLAQAPLALSIGNEGEILAGHRGKRDVCEGNDNSVTLLAVFVYHCLKE